MNIKLEFENIVGLNEASEFFLLSAFNHIDNAFTSERVDLIFLNCIKSIETPYSFSIPESSLTSSELLLYSAKNLPEVKTTELLTCLSHAKREAVLKNDIYFKKTHKIKSIEIAGHILNIHAFVETTINKHLYILKLSEIISGDIFNSLERTEILPKLLYLFKEEVSSKKLNIQPFRTLNKYRNSVVHFKKSSRKKIKPSILELFQIWEEIENLLKVLNKKHSIPSEPSIISYRTDFSEKYLR